MSGERPAPAPPMTPDHGAARPAEDAADVAIDVEASIPPPVVPKPVSSVPEATPASTRIGEGTKRAGRPRMTLKIPDDEVSRPQLTPSSPPARAISDVPPEPSSVPIQATRIITIDPPPPTPSPAPAKPAAPRPVPSVSAPIASPAPPPPPPAPAPGTTATREDSWTPYQPTVADQSFHPPVAAVSPSPPKPLPPPPPKDSAKEVPDPPTMPRAWTPHVPADPPTTPNVNAVAKRGDSMDEIPIVTDGLDSPDSAEPLDLDDAISSPRPVPPAAPVAPPAAPSSPAAATSPSSPASASISGSPATASASGPHPVLASSAAAAAQASAQATPAAPAVAAPTATPVAAPVAMAGTLPINYIKDLPPMRSLAPTEPEGEEVRFDEEEAPYVPRGPRKSDPAEAAEISAEDLVSIESVPSPASAKQSSPSQARPPRPVSLPPQPPVSTPAKGAAAVPVAAQPQARATRVIVPSAGASPLAPPPMSEAAPAGRRRTRPWWEELFNDDFIRTMAKITDEQIAGESNFIEDSLAVAKGAMVLDLACGTGRHAIELTRRGYKVVGFDLSLPMLARAAEEAQERGQKLNFVQGDMREMTFEDTFDGVYCWNTSFGFFEEDRNAQVIQRVHKALRKSGQFLLDVINRDYLIRQAPSLAWFEGEGCICMDEMSIDWITSRMRVKRTMMMDDGRTKEIEYSVRVYSLHELGKVLHDAGFRVAEVSGRASTPGVFFGNESPRTLILAEKR